MTGTTDGSGDGSRRAHRVDVVDLGRRPFAEVHRAMLELHESIRRGESDGKVWLVEHDDVFTAGRATPPDEIRDGVVPIERGGRITWHGPGQLVVYPIVRLPRRDAGAWLRALERFGCAVCGAFGLAAEASVDGTGVFVAGRKLASIGVALRSWINLHGIAINVDVAEDAFAAIRPCGLAPSIMSDLSRAVGRRISLDECKVAARSALPPLLDGGIA
jgi:lipoyl(octanoyl) transferase